MKSKKAEHRNTSSGYASPTRCSKLASVNSVRQTSDESQEKPFCSNCFTGKSEHKKETAVLHAPGLASKSPLSVTVSTISISDFANNVNNFFKPPSETRNHAIVSHRKSREIFPVSRAKMKHAGLSGYRNRTKKARKPVNLQHQLLQVIARMLLQTVYAIPPKKSREILPFEPFHRKRRTQKRNGCAPCTQIRKRKPAF